MRLYCLISFWTLVAGLFFRMVYIVDNDYPRVVTYKSAAEDLMWMLFTLGIGAWLGNILWGWF